MKRQEIIDQKLKRLKDKRLIFLAFWLANKRSSTKAVNVGKYTEQNLFNDLRRYFNKKFPELQVKKIKKLWEKFKHHIEKNENFTIMHHLRYNEISDGRMIFNLHQIILEQEIKKQFSSITDFEIKTQIFFFLRNWELLLSGNNSKSDKFHNNYNIELQKSFKITAHPEINSILVELGLLFESTYIHYRDYDHDIEYNVPDYYIKVLGHILIPELLKDEKFSEFLKKIRIYSVDLNHRMICEICGSEIEINSKVCSMCGEILKLI